MSPNIIHISMHDAGRHFGCYGVETVQSPHLDALAAGGVRFTRAFACAAVCSPSRGACMTGRYPQANGLIHLCHGDFGYRYHQGEKHLSHLLRERGYYTVLHGFQHEAHHDEARAALGFEELVNADPAPPIYPVPPADVIARGACEFLEKYAANGNEMNRPFYMQLGFFESHRPYDFGGAEPDDSRGVTVPPYLRETEHVRQDHAGLQGAIRKADTAIGKVLDTLRGVGLEQETLVIFTPDHGLANPRAKATNYDPGIEIAMILRWPGGGLEAGKVTDRLVSNVDVLPTLWDLCGWEKPPNFQGVSFAGELGATPEAPAPRDAVYALHHDGDVRSVRTVRHKLIRNFSKRNGVKVPVQVERLGHPILQSKGAQTHLPPVELYDVQADPLETENRADDPALAEVRRDLEDRLWAWMESVEDPILQGAYTTPRHKAALEEYQQFR